MSRKIVKKLSFDCFGHLVPFPLDWSLAETTGGLLFRARRETAGRAHPQSRAETFQEELWRFEVAEVFFCSEDRERYLEVNLAPNGAWWICAFDGIRCKADSQPNLADVRVAHRVQKEAWEAEIFLPDGLFDTLPPSFYNVTAILDQSPQRFLSEVPLPGDEPNFHQPAAFRPLDWRDGS